MGYTVDLKKSSRQQASNSVKEKAVSPLGNKSLKFLGKLKEENTIGQPRSEHYHEFRQKADGKPIIQMKPSGNPQTLSQGDKKKGDELVKHMSNLPGYLQQIEREENVQEKALNFGVLDWQRLERWKYDEKLIPARVKTNSCSSKNSSHMAGGTSFISSTMQRKSIGSQRKHLPSHGWRPNSAFVDGQDVPSQRNVKKYQTFETASWSTINGKQNLRPNDKSSGLKYSEIPLNRGKKKELNCSTTPEKVSSLSSCREHELPITLGKTMSVRNGETNTTLEEELDLAPKLCSNENIVLLLPKSSSTKSFSENIHSSESRNSFDGNLAEAIGRRLSGSFYPEELHSIELYSEVPHSCPLPGSVSTKVEPDTEQKNLVKCEGPEQFGESYSNEKLKNITTPASEGKPLKLNSSDIEPSTVTESSRRSDQDPAERPAAKGRHPSPRRRFSFSSFGKMTKNFSLKEGAAEPQLNSSYTTIKSGPVGSLFSADSDKLGQDSASAGSRARSSPLRRLLDPLLKPKAVHSTESVKLSKINSDSVTIKPIDTTELLRGQKCDTSSVQALLQLTLKNGLPLFKLVVDNSSDILAAAVKKLPTPEEDVPSLIYALYSVHEIKKKTGNWLSQGSKGKTSSLGYNVIGQMTVSSSHPPVRESILYGVDIGQDDKEAPKFTPSRELAALVINNPRNTNDDEEQSTNSDDYFGNNNSVGLDIEDYNSTTVILPGGIHGLPKEGSPSSIMNRWRSRGSCDCGGWDVGCKLQILTNQGHDNENMRHSPSHSALEGLDLFVEGGHQEKKPIFCLAPFTGGVYSVDFDPSISLLQAFFIAVSFLSSQRLSDLFEVKLEINKFPEPTHDTVKPPTAVYVEAPARYVTNPPTSPVGRV